MRYQDLWGYRIHGLGQRRVGEEAGFRDGEQIRLIGRFVVLHHMVVLIRQHDGHRVAGTSRHADGDAGDAFTIDDLLKNGNGVIHRRTSHRRIGSFVLLAVAGHVGLGYRDVRFRRSFLAGTAKLQETGKLGLRISALDVAESDDADDDQKDRQQTYDQNGNDIEIAAAAAAPALRGFLPTGRCGLVLFVFVVLIVLIAIVVIPIVVLILIVVFVIGDPILLAGGTRKTSGLGLGFQLLYGLIIVVIVLILVLIVVLILFIDNAALLGRCGSTGEDRLLGRLDFFLFFVEVLILQILVLVGFLRFLRRFEAVGTASRRKVGSFYVATLGTEFFFDGLFCIGDLGHFVCIRLILQIGGADLAEGRMVGVVGSAFFTNHRTASLDIFT